MSPLGAIINDMDTTSAAALARDLGTSVPRVVRTARRLGIDARQPNGRYAFVSAEADRMRRALGVTPVLDGLSRSETRVLASLRNAPFGLVTARAVARRTGLSATAAARALRVLQEKKLVERSSELVAAGHVREMRVWRASFQHPRWPELDRVLARVEPPQKRARPKPRGTRRVPGRLRHLFWNTADSQLDVSRAGPYIARRLLQTLDLQGLAWGAKTLAPKDWKKAAEARGLDPKVRQLARNLASASR
jgi:hypothetical protein